MPNTQWAPPQGHVAGVSLSRLPPGPMLFTLPYDRAHLSSGHLGMSFGFQQFRVPGPCGLPRATLYAQATNCLLQCPEITLLFRPAPLPPPSHQAQNSHMHHAPKQAAGSFLPFDNSSALSKCWHNPGHRAWCSLRET